MADVTISVANVVVGEAGGAAAFVVRLNKASTVPVTVAFETVDGTAGNGSDYSSKAGILTFAPGTTVKTVPIPIIDDTMREPSESFFFDLSSPTHAVIANSFALGTIIDNDAPAGTPVIAISDPVVDETAGQAAFSITLDRPSTKTVTVHYTTQAGTAGTADFGATGNKVLTFAPGQTAKTVNVPIVNDTKPEGNERFSLVLSGVTGASVPDPVGTATIWANDQKPVAKPAISVANVVVGENDAFAEFVVSLSAPSAAPVSVDFATENGTAESGFDYSGPLFGTLHFVPGVTVQTLRVPIINDTVKEPTETFRLHLSGATNATVATANATAAIVDDDSHFEILQYGLSNDTYIVSHANTFIIEAPDGGTDLVKASVGFTLPANVENLTLTGTKPINGTGNTLANILTGNSAANVFTGNAGNDTLNGGGGADRLVGGTGNDTYIVDNTGVTVVENPGQGTDTVKTTLAKYTLGPNVENLILTGTKPINGIGNTLGNMITGNSAANVLSGNAGNDTLNGGGGADRLVGGTGNDTYIVDNTGVAVIENPGQGTDTVKTTLTKYTLPGNVENLVFTGKGNFTGTGNSLANSITGGSGNDTLNGGGGNDTLTGGTGNDTYIVANIGVVVVENFGQGTDTVKTRLAKYTLGPNVENLIFTGTGNFTGIGNALANSIIGGTGRDTLTGGAGNDMLNGGGGNDTLTGGTGNDTYIVDNTGVAVVEKPGQGTDTVRTTLAKYTLGNNVENLVFTGKGNFTGTGNGLANSITGGAGKDTLNGGGGNDVLDGETGADRMAGGAGNDTYIVDNAGDRVTELAGQGTDTVRTTLAKYTLGNNIENLVFTGKGNFTGTGNSLVNSITGGSGSDTLNGSGGNDTLTGGAGNDTYIVDNTGVLVVEKSGQGTDTVRTTLKSYTLGANVEKLIFTGKGNFTGTGNILANRITGGSGNDTLNGGGGNDTLTGGTGNDTYIVDNTGVLVVEKAGQGTDTVKTTLAKYTLGPNVENLTLTGTKPINGTGNTLANILTGNSAANVLTGNAGNDTLNGGGGADRLIGGTGNDTYIIDNAGVTVVENPGQGTDMVRTTLKTYTLGANVENLVFTGKGSFTGIGNALANSIIGGAGNDTLKGGAGNDTLAGGGGTDTLTGGSGADLFVFTMTKGTDTITDFTHGTDKIAFSDAGFNLGADEGKGTATPQQLAASVFSPHANGTMATKADRFAYNAGTGALLYDPDGSGTRFGATQVAALFHDPHISVADLFFIR